MPERPRLKMTAKPMTFLIFVLPLINSSHSDHKQPTAHSLAVVPAGIAGIQNTGMSIPLAVLGFWVPAQICLEQIRINPKGGRQGSLT